MSESLVLMSSSLIWPAGMASVGAIRFVERTWGLIQVRPFAALYTTADGMELFYEHGGPPRENAIREALRGTHLDNLEPGDFIRVMVSLLDASACLEDVVGDVVFRDVTLNTIGADGSHLPVEEVAKAAWYANESNVPCALVAGACDKVLKCEVGAVVDIAEKKDVGGGLAMKCVLEVVCCRSELLSRIAVEREWMRMKGVEAMSRLLDIMNERWRCRGRVATELVQGAHFGETAKRYGFCHEESKVKRLIARLRAIVDSSAEDRGHALREGKGANEPDIVVDGWAAWRYDIDHEWHLHVWFAHLSGVRIVELAAIVSHKDMGIPRREPVLRYERGVPI